MSSILCYWTYSNYLYDVEQGHIAEIPSFNSNQSRLHSVPNIGEKAYIVTYNEGQCYLVGKITIAKKEFNQSNYRYGRYKIVGNPAESAYYEYRKFNVTNFLVEFIKRNLNNKDVPSELPHPIPQYLQTIRELTEQDATALDAIVSVVDIQSSSPALTTLDLFLEDLQMSTTNYFIFDTKGGGSHGDIDFVKYDWSPSRYNLVNEGDLFIYRRPDKSSETGGFYFFGACKIGQIVGNTRYSATFSKKYPFKNTVHKSDLDNFEWVWKQRGDSWGHFFNQYGMNKITRDDFVTLLSMSEEGMENLDIDFASEVSAIQAIQGGDYLVEDSRSERAVRSKQKPFSDKVKLIYKYSCCICSLRTKPFLVGSHIIPWRIRKDIRLDPSNGLCLCVLHDKAFDRGYLTIDENYHIHLASSVENDVELLKHLQPYKGKRIFLPTQHRPKIEYLTYHRENIFKGQ